MNAIKRQDTIMNRFLKDQEKRTNALRHSINSITKMEHTDETADFTSPKFKGNTLRNSKESKGYDPY